MSDTNARLNRIEEQQMVQRRKMIDGIHEATEIAWGLAEDMERRPGAYIHADRAAIKRLQRILGRLTAFGE